MKVSANVLTGSNTQMPHLHCKGVSRMGANCASLIKTGLDAATLKEYLNIKEQCDRSKNSKNIVNFLHMNDHTIKNAVLSHGKETLHF
jgi:hypothetical protein